MERIENERSSTEREKVKDSEVRENITYGYYLDSSGGAVKIRASVMNNKIPRMLQQLQ